MLSSSMKIHNAASGVESYSVLFHISSMLWAICASQGQQEEEKATVLLQCREQMEKASEPSLESWSEALPYKVDGSFAGDGFWRGLRLPNSAVWHWAAHINCVVPKLSWLKLKLWAILGKTPRAFCWEALGKYWFSVYSLSLRDYFRC